MKKISILLLSFLLITSSCYGDSQFKEPEGNFPLEKSLTLHVNENIQELAIADDWAVVQTPSKLAAIDLATKDILWTLDGFSADIDSQFEIAKNIFTTVSYERILVIDRVGETRTIDLDADGGDIIQLIAAYNDYLYLIRGPLWFLEVYDTSQNTLLWKTWVGRGQTNAFYDARSGVAYIVTTQSVQAFENSSGKLLWERKYNSKQSYYDSKILYLCEQSDNSGKFRFVAIDVENGKELWIQEYALGENAEIYQLSIVKNMLIATTRFHYLAIDKNNGNPLWQSQEPGDIFYNSVIEYNNVLYTRGSSGELYAISIEDGTVIGAILPDENPPFQSIYEASQKVYRLTDGIAVSTAKKIVVWKNKNAG